MQQHAEPQPATVVLTYIYITYEYYTIVINILRAHLLSTQ